MEKFNTQIEAVGKPHACSPLCLHRIWGYLFIVIIFSLVIYLIYFWQYQ
ncbi:MAG: hypothetical protein ACM3KM_02490 [Acidobacteriaceae bacterium]